MFGCLPAKTMQLSSCRTADMISLVLPSVNAGTSSQIRYTTGQPYWYLNVKCSLLLPACTSSGAQQHASW